MKEKLKWILTYFPEVVASAAMVMAVSITGVNALTRYILGYTYAGSSELVSLGFVWVIFLAAAGAYRNHMHYGIDMVITALPIKAQRIANLISHLVTLAIMAICTWLAYNLLCGVGTKVMPATHISYFWFDLPAVLAFVLMTIYTLKSIVGDLRGETKINVEGGKVNES